MSLAKLLVFPVLLSIAAAILWFVYYSNAPGITSAITGNGAGVTAPITAASKRELLDFHMANFNQGWARYSDGVVATEDGGVTWLPAPAEAASVPQANGDEETAAVSWLSGKDLSPPSIQVQAQEYAVHKSQFLSRNVGWAMLVSGTAAEAPLWVTVDGGTNWSSKVTADIAVQIQAEHGQILAAVKETSFYAEQAAAQKAMEASWTLMPDTASPGDVVLVRHQQPGEVEWEGKTYTLEPFGTGYFTYLPISIGLKAGSYPIGDTVLTITAKKFQTQYLQVTKQMESMKQDTSRIQADQKKIDLARSQSQAEFLGVSNYIIPVEGRLTTPYGYTRYVNGKFDSSHRALDLAAKEGTPIKATNDGIVALSDMLYLTGNSIYIDHGMGLFSQYAHMSELLVSAGDYVKQGDIIGLVGTTGFSTGPHLHFTFWAHNVPVNPNLFFDTTPFQWTTPAEGQ
ncbi:M23 family metallopeptidase [Paenibacillus sp. S3N08]|uniref:M23 family metallopeptidase n=2 Tax=Paenibacillus agricola TaxID=2716264 RepID=A0ABX0J7U5_9BACL|nr:M23 family metallopeptidase [Paenibacillus agricola]